MKRFYYLLAIMTAILSAAPLHAQEEGGNNTQQQQQAKKGPRASRGERLTKEDNNGLPELTVRAQDMN